MEVQERIGIYLKKCAEDLELNVGHKALSLFNAQNGELAEIVALQLEFGGQLVLGQLVGDPQLTDLLSDEIFPGVVDREFHGRILLFLKMKFVFDCIGETGEYTSNDEV